MSELSVDYHAELKRHNYVTPTSYLELIGAFRSLLDKQRGMVSQARHTPCTPLCLLATR